MERPQPHFRTFIHIPSPCQDLASSLTSSGIEEPLAPVQSLRNKMPESRQLERYRQVTGLGSERRKKEGVSVEWRGRGREEDISELKHSPSNYSRLLPQYLPLLSTPSKSPAYTRRRSLPRISPSPRSRSKAQLPAIDNKRPLRRVAVQRMSFGYLNWRKLRRDPELRRSPLGRYEYVDGRKSPTLSPFPDYSLRILP